MFYIGNVKIDSNMKLITNGGGGGGDMKQSLCMRILDLFLCISSIHALIVWRKDFFSDDFD